MVNKYGYQKSASNSHAKYGYAKSSGDNLSQDEELQVPQIQGIASIPGDIANQLISMGVSAGKKAIELPGEISDAAQQIVEHPFTAPPRAARGVLAGLMEGGKQIFNIPGNLGGYLSKKDVPVFNWHLPGVGPTLGELAQKIHIGDTGLQKLIMGKQQKGDQLWQDIGELAPMIVAPETIAAKMPGSHLLSKRIAARPYKQAAKALEEAGVGKIKPNLELIKDAKQYFKDTKANRELIKKAETGDITALFKLQSDLGKISAGYSRNPFSFAERDFGRAGLQTRETLLEHKGQQLKDMGLEDIAALLEKGRKQFRQYNKLKPLKYTLAAGALSQTPIPSYLKKLMFHQ